MNTLVVVATEDTPLAHIARVLLEEKISSIPIINKAFHLTGMITRSDLLRAIVYNQLILK
jgi:CBS domain-containing protein